MFQKDLFSYSKIKWKKNKNKKVIQIINNYILKKQEIYKNEIFQHGGLELNSKNYKIKINGKYKILKKWDYVDSNRHLKNINPNNIKNSLSVLSWLSENNSRVLKPETFINNQKLINVNKTYWSIFPFYEGEHYNGKNANYKKITKVIAQISQNLLKYPMQKKINKKSFKGLNDTKKIIKLMNKNVAKWSKYFGKKNSKTLKSYWPKIIEIHNFFEKNKNKKKYLAPIHTDLHPHNLLINKKKDILVLDPDSIMIAPVGEAIAYAGLKICRQHITKNKLQKFASNIGEQYIKIINTYYPSGKKFSDNYYYLSLSYVVERLINIFRLNILKKERKWNNFLLMLLNHIDESEKIFKK